MKVVVIGSGGREHAIAWACRRHRATRRRSLPELPDRPTSQARPRHPRPRGGAGRRRRRRVRPPRHPVLRPNGRTGATRVVEGLCTRAGDLPRHPRPAHSPASRATTTTQRSRGIEQARPPGRGQARRPGRRQGGHDPRDAEADTIAAIGVDHRAVPPRGADDRPGVLAHRPVRRNHRRRPAAGPGSQAHRRGRHRPEHRRHGRVRPGSGRRTTPTSWWRRSSSRSSTTSPPPARRTSGSSTPG